MVSANTKFELGLKFTSMFLSKLQLLNKINSCGIQKRLLVSSTVKEILITGNERVNTESIKLFGKISIGDNLKKNDLNQIVKDLYETNFFEFIDLTLEKSILKINVVENPIIQNLIIKVLKCYNSEFDDDPDVTAYMQVKDTTINSNDKVFIFNDWTFASSPSIRPFDHPVYDVWLKKCYS